MTALENAIDSLAGYSAMSGIDEENVLGGYLGQLVAAGKMTKEAAVKVKRATNATVRAKALHSTMSKEQLFLFSQTPKLKEQIKVDVVKGRNMWEMMHLYKATQVSGGGSVDLLKPDERIAKGICNLSNRKLPVNSAMALGKIKLSYAFLADVINATTDPGRATYTNAKDAETAGTAPLPIPPAILNGEVELVIGNQSRLTLPCSRFFRESLSVGIAVEGKFDAVELDNPILIQGGEDIQVRLHFAEGQTFTTNATSNHFIKVDLMGIGVSNK